MGSDGVEKTPASPLRQLCDRAKLGDETITLLTDDFTTKEFIGLLSQERAVS